MLNHEQLNEAIINYLTVMYAKEALEDIKEVFGVDTGLLIEKIASSATNNTIWSNLDQEANYNTVLEELAQEYPYLSKASRLKIADIAAYFWK
jgi:hypothetical protein